MCVFLLDVEQINKFYLRNNPRVRAVLEENKAEILGNLKKARMTDTTESSLSAGIGTFWII